MGENDIKLGPGQLYFIEPDGNASLVGHVTDASVEYGTDLNDISEVVASLASLEASFEMVAKVAKDVLLAITDIGQAVINCCPDRRVAHLAVHGKKARTRKKNFNRAIRILEEME